MLALLPLVTGCARYYRVADPHTHDIYYTRDVDRRDSGAVEFTEAKTKAKVTLQSSVVERITKQLFHEAVGAD